MNELMKLNAFTVGIHHIITGSYDVMKFISIYIYNMLERIDATFYIPCIPISWFIL